MQTLQSTFVTELAKALTQLEQFQQEQLRQLEEQQETAKRQQNSECQEQIRIHDQQMEQIEAMREALTS